jgi:hypothetical protein
MNYIGISTIDAPRTGYISFEIVSSCMMFPSRRRPKKQTPEAVAKILGRKYLCQAVRTAIENCPPELIVIGMYRGTKRFIDDRAQLRIIRKFPNVIGYARISLGQLYSLDNFVLYGREMP